MLWPLANYISGVNGIGFRFDIMSNCITIQEHPFQFV